MTALGVARFVLPPVLNRHYQEIVARDLYDVATCDQIRTRAAEGPWTAAGITTSSDTTDAYDARIRSAEVSNLTDDGSWPLDALVTALAEINAEVFRFELSGLFESDAPSVTRYRAEQTDHFRPHQDAGGIHARRKLTYVVQLSAPSEYVGGDLLFNDAGKVAPRTQGTLIVFPSTLVHVVTPVISGERQVIVGWVHGPTLS